MTAPLESADWYRVAGLRARFDARAGPARQVVRGRVWQVLTDPQSGRQVRLNAPAWAFVGRCDGRRSVDAIWRQLHEEQGDDAPTQDDILQLLPRLQRAGVLRVDDAPDLAAMFARHGDAVRRRRRAWVNPLALKVRLGDPTRLLDRLVPHAGALFHPLAAALWALGVTIAALACLVHLPRLAAGVAPLLDAPRTVLLFWLCFPPIKAVHELAHALAVRHFGGAVREAGITLLVFTPSPYVDASAASAFDSRRRRALVSAAGIAAELAIAALAALVWFAVEPGLTRDLALVTLVITTVSSLLVNGNPLLRFDGYYVLIDLLDLPNLALRSNAWWATQARRLLIGADAPEHAFLAPGERKWLIAYAPLSWACRAMLLGALVLWAGAYAWMLGALAGIAFAVWLLHKPVVGAAHLLQAAAPGRARRRALAVLAGGTGALGLVLFALPLPSATVAQGVVWPPDHAQVRAQTAGFVAALAAADGAPVAAGDPLLTLAEPALEAERERKAAQLAGLKAQQYTALLRDPLAAGNLALDVARAEAELAHVVEQEAALEVRSQGDGRLVLPRAADLPGSFAPRGAMIGYILGPEPANVRAVLGQDDAQLVRARTRRVEVRLAEDPATVLAARLGGAPPAATRSLPSAALGDAGGGRVPVDRAAPDGLRAVEPVFLQDVTVDAPVPQRIGGRVWVRFDLGLEPVGTRALRRLRQLLLRHFNPAGQA
ncbi:MAG: PqqD family peptide modification chaperone [Burkholderiales bacterium]|nr:PqqD family peptide modification chaperone [Burkholderiales bacterium]